jgi:uncharacterized protein YecE (DUF72 family)
MVRARDQFYCGTSNVALPERNKTLFPEEFQDKSRLAYYSTLYNSIEINASFHKIPLPRTIERWVREVPEDFLFTFKLFRGITHSKELSYNKADLERFLEVANLVGDQKGCLLLQFPASVKASGISRIEALLSHISTTRKAEGWKLAIEFRDVSWYREEVFDLLKAHNTALVVHDMPRGAPPPLSLAADFVYVRFHGENGRYRGSYSNEFLYDQGSRIKEWMSKEKTVFAYFNNTMGEAAKNALTLKQLI